ncbi:uncharacterized protein CEXT_646391 [Caerostris extrusa]|uniref:Uncharacterized protein n=1 Tax=Caerostris extrusa TaxID=172846 RepID=A0AAV4M8Q9_CAEEX|nr:uncharacterized protein CEXT_646391 [Caerostris extrusa]
MPPKLHSGSKDICVRQRVDPPAIKFQPFISPATKIAFWIKRFVYDIPLQSNNSLGVSKLMGKRGKPPGGCVMKSIKLEISYTSSFLPWISEGLATYSNQKKADMPFMYDLENGNALVPFPRRHVTDCIDACVKQGPLSSACVLQRAAGVCGRHKL